MQPTASVMSEGSPVAGSTDYQGLTTNTAQMSRVFREPLPHLLQTLILKKLCIFCMHGANITSGVMKLLCHMESSHICFSIGQSGSTLIPAVAAGITPFIAILALLILITLILLRYTILDASQLLPSLDTAFTGGEKTEKENIL